MTHADIYNPQIHDAVEAFVKERFSEVRIVSVSFEEDTNRDGDRVLEITIVFDGTAKQIAQQEPPGFLRGLREKLYSLHETAFPIVSFKAA